MSVVSLFTASVFAQGTPNIKDMAKEMVVEKANQIGQAVEGAKQKIADKAMDAMKPAPVVVTPAPEVAPAPEASKPATPMGKVKKMGHKKGKKVNKNKKAK